MPHWTVMPPPYKNQNNSAGGEQEDEESNQLPITDFPPGGFNAFVPFPAPALNFDPFQNLRAFAHNFPLSVGNNLAFTGEFASSAFTPNQSRFNPPAAELGTSAMQHRPLSPPTGPSANDMSSPAQHSKAAMKLQLDSRAAELREQLLKRRKEGTPDSGVFVPHPVPKLTAAQPNVPANDNDIAALIADISAAAPEPMASASPDQASDGKKQGPQAQPNGEPALQKHQQQNAHNNGEAVNQKKNGASHASHANGRTIDTTKLRDAARKASQWYGQSADRGSNSSNSNSFNGSSTLAKIGSSADAALPPKPPTSSRQTALMSRNIATASPSGVSEDGEITENSPRWAEETNPLPHENRRALVGRKNTNPGANNTTAPTPQTNETASVNSFRKPQQDDRPTLSDVQKEPQADNAVELAADDADRRIDPSDKELQEWLIVTDYWNLKHRQGVLARRRRIALLEAEREQLLGEEAAAFTSRGNTTTAPPRPAPVRAMIANTGAPPAPVRATTANAGAPPAPIQQKSIEAPVAMAPEAANPPKETQPTRPPKREYEDTDNDVLHSEKHRRIDERQDGPRPRTAASASHRVHQRDPSPYRIRGPPSPDWPSSRHNSPTRYDNPHYRRDWSPDRGRYEPDSGGPRPPHYFDSDGYVARRYDDHRDHGMDDGRGGQGHGPLGPGRGQPPYVIRKAKQVDLGKKGGEFPPFPTSFPKRPQWGFPGGMPLEVAVGHGQVEATSLQ